jgi:hypothetical protein
MDERERCYSFILSRTPHETWAKILKLYTCLTWPYHHQPINVPTAGAQTFLMDNPQGERAITHHNPLVAFNDIHGGKREVLFFYFVPDTTRDHTTPQVNLSWLRYLFFPTLIPLSRVGTTCFHYIVIKIRHLFLRPAASHQPSLKLEWVQTTANAAGKHGGARDNKFWTPVGWLAFANVA